MTVTCRNENLEPYLNWILETLFTVQLGTRENKQQLASVVAGIPIQDIKAMCSTTSSLISCIYLFQIGCVKDLKDKLQLSKALNGDDMIYKWGRTENLANRAYQHGRSYGKDITLIYKGFIDKRYLVEAESELRSFFKNEEYKITAKGHNELSLISSKNMKDVKKHYAKVSEKYVGRVSILIEELKDVAQKHAIVVANKDVELAKKDVEIANKNTDLAKKDTDLVIISANKDVEILKLQMKILELTRS